MLCPVRALCIYLDRTQEFRRGVQLFASWAARPLQKHITKQRLSLWIVGAIALVYSMGLQSHSIHGLAAYGVQFKAVSVQEM